jgi:predicted KAP-like P-loop ATPase
MARYISSDTPIEFPEQDKYRRNTFVGSILKSINSAPVDKSTVIGLYGKWGSGKTSIINLIEAGINDSHLAEPLNADRPIIIRLNPWLFPNARELSASLMKQIADAYQKSKNAKARLLSKLILDYAAVICGTLTLNPLLIKLPAYAMFMIKTIEFVREKLIAKFFSQKTLSDFRSEIDFLLKNEFKKTIIVIDDIDRLEIDEICEIMQFVRGVCDFPNTVWVLSCDKTQVAEALDKRYGLENGEIFLEKIIQLWYSVPDPNNTDIHNLLIEKLEKINTEIQHGPFDIAAFHGYYSWGIKPLISTPRDLVRYTNLANKSVADCEDEVCLHDLFAIEAINCAFPRIYSLLLSKRDVITSHKGQPDELKLIISEIESIAGKKVDAVKFLVKMLFPYTASVIDNYHYGPEFEAVWRKECRLCHPSLFSYYASMNLNEGDIPRKEFLHFLDSLTNAEEIKRKLTTCTFDVYKSLLRRLEDYDGEYDEAWIVSGCVGILESTRRIIPGPSDNIFFDNHMIISRIVYRLLRQISDPLKLQTVVDDVFSQVDLPSSKSILLQIIGHEEGAGHRLCEEKYWADKRSEFYDRGIISTPEIINADPFFSDYIFDGLRPKLLTMQDCLVPEVFFRILKTRQSWASSSEIRTGRSERKLSLPIKWFYDELGYECIKKCLDDIVTNGIAGTTEDVHIVTVAYEILKEISNRPPLGSAE